MRPDEKGGGCKRLSVEAGGRKKDNRKERKMEEEEKGKVLFGCIFTY